MKNIFLLRHPPLINNAGLCIGQTDAQAINAGYSAGTLDFLKKNKITKIFSSDLGRCSKPAEELSVFLETELVIAENLRETSFGEWENRSWEDIRLNDPLAGKWFENIEEVVPPGGEPLAVFRKRAEEAVAACSNNGGNVLVLTHAGVIRSVLAAITKSDYINMFSVCLDYNGITGIEWNTCYADCRLLFVNRTDREIRNFS